MDFEEIKQILMKYGEQLDENDLELFQDTFVNETGKIIVDGKKLFHLISLFNYYFFNLQILLNN